MATKIQDDWEVVQHTRDLGSEPASVHSLDDSIHFSMTDGEFIRSAESGIDSPSVQSALPPKYDEAINLPMRTLRVRQVDEEE